MIAIESCLHGHPLTTDNLRIVTIRGKECRQCRQCDKERAQAKRDLARGDRPKFNKKELAEKCFRGHPMEGDNLYLYATKWGTQRRCRACEEFRRQERIASGETTAPTKTHCIRGHALEGDNVSYRPDGYAVCLKCSVVRTMKHKNANYDEVLDRKTQNRRRVKNAIDEVAKAVIMAIFVEDLDDDELIGRLRAALPPTAV